MLKRASTKVIKTAGLSSIDAKHASRDTSAMWPLCFGRFPLFRYCLDTRQSFGKATPERIVGFEHIIQPGA
jgi:hypothetical protein